MKTTLIFLLTALTVAITFGQITTTKVAPQTEQIDNTPYDSTRNFLGKDVNKYVGQDLYLKGLSEGLREYGYEGFQNNNKSDSHSKTSYNKLAGKYFTVLEVTKHPKAADDALLYGSKYFLKLEEKKSKDIIYYKYDNNLQFQFPFIVVGYFEKGKKRYIGTDYILRGKNWIDGNPEMHDIQSGKSVDFSAGTVWKCVDFTIEEKYFALSLILENSKGERLSFPVDNILKGTYFAFSKVEADTYTEKFGIDNWSLILKGKVIVGFTKEMCKLSWGEPKSINETITSGKKSEQWVYKNNFLYFDNGIVTAMQ